MNCEFACHERNPDLPFDAKECDIKIGLHMENKMGHAFHPDIMYYGSHLVMVTPMSHDGSGDEWVVNQWFWHFNLDETYFDECFQQNSRPLIEYNLNVNWKDAVAEEDRTTLVPGRGLRVVSVLHLVSMCSIMDMGQPQIR
jgi:hypothetical protein